jgi:hypothetical protein
VEILRRSRVCYKQKDEFRLAPPRIKTAPLAPLVLFQSGLLISACPVPGFMRHRMNSRSTRVSAIAGVLPGRPVTTSQTLESNRRCIEWKSMPRTFRDAIHFTRRLGIRFILIDSICIIQDDEIDWRAQSAAMASIYENAYLTLCATHSSSDNGGCYSYLRPNYIVKKTNMVKKDGREYDVYFRVLSRSTRELPDWSRATMHYCRQIFPLMIRAWTYQERLLSPRLLHFTSGELSWECSELRSCECTPTEEPYSPFFRFHGEKKSHSEALTHRDPKDVQKKIGGE